MSTLKERMVKARQEKGLTQAALAKAVGKSQSAIAAVESGRNKETSGLIAIARALDVSPEWLETGVGEMHPRPIEANARPAPPLRFWSSRDPLPEEDYAFAPFLKDFAFIGGAGCEEGSDYNNFRLPFGKSTLRRLGVQIENVFCCTLEGDSMWPRIPDGATIAVDKGRTAIKDGDIYAFVQGGLYRVKYLYKLPGGRVRIRSQNEEEHPEETASLEDIQIVGRVFWVSSLFY